MPLTRVNSGRIALSNPEFSTDVVDARTIVSAALPPGVTTPAETDALLEARRRGVLIVLSSRAGSGRVLPRTLVRERGFVVADNLNPQKARVLTMLALTRTADVAEIQRMFDEY